MSILCVIVVLIICCTIGWLCTHKPEQHKEIPHSDPWQQLVGIAAEYYLPTNKTWRDPDGKENLVKVLYNSKVPQHLCYTLGSNKPTKEDELKIAEQFWGLGERNLGDFRIEQTSSKLIGRALIIHMARKFATEVIVNGQKCPLYQVGYPQKEDTKYIFFPELYAQEEQLD